MGCPRLTPGSFLMTKINLFLLNLIALSHRNQLTLSPYLYAKPDPMLQRLMTLMIASALMATLSCGGAKESTTQKTSFIAPGYVKKKYNKILVLAHVDPDIFRKRIERNVIEEFKDRKYNVAGSLEFFKPEMVADSAALRQEILNRGFDGALVLTYLGEMTQVSDTYMANGNIYNIFSGAYPVFDLDTKANKNYYFQADFFTLQGKGTQWRAGVFAKGGQDADVALRDMANVLRRKMQDDGIL